MLEDVAFVKQLSVWLPEIVTEVFLLGVVPGAFAFPAAGFLKLLPGVWALGVGIAVVLFLHGYYLTRALLGLLWRNEIWWLYSTIAVAVFLVNTDVVFLRGRPDFSPEGRALEAPFLACGACVVFGCTSLSSRFLRR
jgi:hypothetical protein